jgi:hypothetical protein
MKRKIMVKELERERDRLLVDARACRAGKHPVTGSKLEGGYGAVMLSRVNRELCVAQLSLELLNIIRVDELLLSERAQIGYQKLVRLRE